MLISTRNVKLSRKLNCSKHSILKIIQDPQRILRMSPLIIAVTPDANDPTVFTVTESIPVLGLFQTTTTFKVTVKATPDGVHLVSNASLGTTVDTHMTIVDDEANDEACVLNEDANVMGVVFLLPYIVDTMTKGHLIFFDELEKTCGEK